jgi:DNA replication licensing factor MCM7
VGSIPRLLNVQLKGELTRTITPGDVVDITGIFLPIQVSHASYRPRM